MPKVNRLTPKERVFVNGKVKGMTQRKAYIKAYQPKTKNVTTIDNNAYKVSRKERVQAAIDAALVAAEMTPEFAVKELKMIVEQNREIGAKRLAIKDVLELHGWYGNKQSRVEIRTDNAFFNSKR